MITYEVWYSVEFRYMQIMFVENKSLKSTLLEGIDESQVPEIYGGRMPLVPIEDSTY